MGGCSYGKRVPENNRSNVGNHRPPPAFVQERECRSTVPNHAHELLSSTVDYDQDDFDNICPDIVEGLFAGPQRQDRRRNGPIHAEHYDERSHRQSLR